MAKVISLQKVRQAIQKRRETEEQLRDTEDVITAIMNDHSLAHSVKRFRLENMLMNVDEQLELYRKEMESAERTLNAMVAAAERDISRAYGEFEAQMRGMTLAVRKLTGAGQRDSGSEGSETCGPAEG